MCISQCNLGLRKCVLEQHFLQSITCFPLGTQRTDEAMSPHAMLI